jgi:hypothetical protein
LLSYIWIKETARRNQIDLMQYDNSHHETFSKNRSGIVRLNVDTAETSCQTESNYLDFAEIPLHVNSRCPQNVKNALAICSTEARISVEQSRIALKCFGNYLFGQNYYLTPQKSNDSHIGLTNSNHIPSRQTINDHKRGIL